MTKIIGRVEPELKEIFDKIEATRNEVLKEGKLMAFFLYCLDYEYFANLIPSPKKV